MLTSPDNLLFLHLLDYDLIFRVLSPVTSVLIINTGRHREHSLPLWLVSLRWKQFKSDVEDLGENNSILLIWWSFMGSFGL